MKKLSYFLLGGVIFLAACLKETSFLSESTKTYVYEIAYEEEISSYQELPQGTTQETASLMQQLASVPLVKRNKIHIGILEDGSSEWKIQKMKPKATNVIPKENLSSEGAYRTILKNNTAYYFGKKGQLLYSEPFETPDFSDFLKHLREKDNSSMYKSALADSSTQMIYLNDSIVELHKTVTENDSPNNPESWGKTFVNLVNLKQGNTLSEKIYDGTELVYEKSNIFSETYQMPVPEISYTKMNVKDSKGKMGIYNSFCQRENINVVNNL